MVKTPEPWRALSAPGDEGRETVHVGYDAYAGAKPDRRVENRIRRMERAASQVVVRRKDDAS